METFSVRLKSIGDVKEFVRIVNSFEHDVDLVSGRYIVDAKSIMGIFSLDLAGPIKVEVHDEAGAVLKQELASFICD
ncbi:MAG: HPr family phosphocarrier protein [Saccharofermentanales bacterium]